VLRAGQRGLRCIGHASAASPRRPWRLRQHRREQHQIQDSCDDLDHIAADVRDSDRHCSGHDDFDGHDSSKDLDHISADVRDSDRHCSVHDDFDGHDDGYDDGDDDDGHGDFDGGDDFGGGA